MSKIRAIVAKEIREALPATIFFLGLFHMIGLTKAVVLDDYSFTALRAAGATMGALIVAKAILIVDALPMARLASSGRIVQTLWTTLRYGVVALLIRFLEEYIPLVSKHGGLASAMNAMLHEVSWPLFAVLSLWILGGLFLYCLATELARAVGPDKVKEAFFRRNEASPRPSGSA